MKNLLTILLLVNSFFKVNAQTTLLPFGSNDWKFYVNASSPSEPPSSSTLDWKSPNYVTDNPNWRLSKTAPLGYSSTIINNIVYYHSAFSNTDISLGDTINPGTNVNGKPLVTYYRKTITVPNLANYTSFSLTSKRDDGIVVYFNGSEVYRDRMPAGTPTASTAADNCIGGGTCTSTNENGITVTFLPNSFNVSPNANQITITAEVHQNPSVNSVYTTSSDSFFDLQLTGLYSDPNKIVAYGSNWNYSATGAIPSSQNGNSWFSNGFDFSSWPQGPSSFGFNETVNTTLPSTIYTAYFRKDISIPNFASYTNYYLKLVVDDGAVIYFNGVRVAYLRMDDLVSYQYNTFANTIVGSGQGQVPEGVEVIIPVSSSYVTSSNLKIAVEVHQCDANSSDMFFNLELIASNESPTITRGPYLQLPHPTGMQIRWKTSIPTNSLVKYKLFNAVNFSDSLLITSLDTNHIVTLTGLLPNSKYDYTIGYKTTNSIKLQGDIGINQFITPPNGYLPGKTTRIWATGDCGADSALLVKPISLDNTIGIGRGQLSSDYTQIKVKNKFKRYIDSLGVNLDLWLLLGDNAYDFGTDGDFQKNFFTIYQKDRIMKQTPIAPAIGNHEYFDSFYNKNSDRNQSLRTFNSKYRKSHLIDYYKVFSMDSMGLAGGWPSPKRGFYSYNYNNIHFISLDSYGFYGSNQDKLLYDDVSGNTNPQITWLKDDLARNTQKWTIMYWHHSPYTKGRGHDSDNPQGNNGNDEIILQKLRENLIPYLDSKKIDLILVAHSHSYERTKLLKGHYGNSSSFITDESNQNYPSYSNNNHSARFDGSSNSCPYVKNDNTTNEGIVYVVSGSAGWLENDIKAEMLHPAMKYTNMSKGGSVYIEITDNRLDAKWIDEGGGIGDKFTIIKEVNKGDTLSKLITPNDLPAQTPAIQNILPNWPNVQSFIVNGPNINNQTFTNTPVLINNPQIGPVYTIQDPTTCLTQKYRFHFSEDCWTNGVTINNVIDSPIQVLIKSGTVINANNTIKANSRVIYQAANAINLNSNTFKVETNAFFTARIINPCN